VSNRTKVESAIDRVLMDANNRRLSSPALRDLILDAIEQAGFEITRKARSVGNEDGGVSPAVHQAAMREHGGATIKTGNPAMRDRLPTVLDEDDDNNGGFY
jgi:hypothetical protein